MLDKFYPCIIKSLGYFTEEEGAVPSIIEQQKIIKMIQFLIEKGLLFIGPTTLLGMVVLVLTIHCRVTIVTNKKTLKKIKWIQSLGLLALVLGILGQLLGLIDGLIVIHELGMLSSEILDAISSEMLVGGLKTSFIPTLIGLITFLLARLAGTYLLCWHKKLTTPDNLVS